MTQVDSDLSAELRALARVDPSPIQDFGYDASDDTDVSREVGAPCDAVIPEGDRWRGPIANDHRRGAALPAGRVWLRRQGGVVAKSDP